AGKRDGRSDTRRGVEYTRRRVQCAYQSRAASRDNDARRQELVEPGLAHFLARHLEDLHHPRSDDLRQESAGQRLDAIAADLANLDLLCMVDPLRPGVTVVELAVLR